MFAIILESYHIAKLFIIRGLYSVYVGPRDAFKMKLKIYANTVHYC